MAKKSGFSHAFAALTGLVAGELLLFYLRPSFPAVTASLEGRAERFSLWLADTYKVQVAPQIFVPALVAFVLAFLWGITYHLIRHGRRGRG